ncbi:MAG: O-antigen ligase family protein [Syntrophomonadaceae bacterium]|jgi:O-antigen ligase
MQGLIKSVNNWLLYIVPGYVLVDYYLRNSGFGFMASLWDELLFIMLVSVWVIKIAQTGEKPLASSLVLPLIIFYVAVLFVFFVKGGEIQVAVVELRALIQYTFWFFLALNLVSTSQQVKKICDIFLAVGLIVALYGIYQYITGAEIPSTWVDRAEGSVRSRAFSFIGSPNVLGSFLIMQISISFASFMAARHWLKKRIYLGLTGISLLCLIFTLSRGAWLVFFFAFILLGLWLDKRIIALLIILALITPVAVPSVYNRVAYMLSPEYIASSEQGGRIARWSQAVDYWEGAPMAGLGLGKFGGGVAIANYPDAAYSVDNFYLKILTEMGIIGLAAFLYLVFSVLRVGKRAISLARDRYTAVLGTGIFVGLVAVLGHNMVENMFEFPLMATYFWFFAGILVAIPELKQEIAEVKSYG